MTLMATGLLLHLIDSPLPQCGLSSLFALAPVASSATLLATALLVMGLVGYRPLGGCECGCGVHCPTIGMPYARFVCDGFVGYACDDSISAYDDANPLLFHPEPDRVPCAYQEQPVRMVTSLFMFLVPGVCGFLAIPPIRHAIITPPQLEAIKAATRALDADPEAQVADPVCGGAVSRPTNSEHNLLRDTFTSAEWRRTVGASGAVAATGADEATSAAGLLRLRTYLGGRFGVYTLLLSALIGTAYSTGPRLKRFPLFAALCILTVRGAVVNVG